MKNLWDDVEFDRVEIYGGGCFLLEFLKVKCSMYTCKLPSSVTLPLVLQVLTVIFTHISWDHDDVFSFGYAACARVIHACLYCVAKL